MRRVALSHRTGFGAMTLRANRARRERKRVAGEITHQTSIRRFIGTTACRETGSALFQIAAGNCG
jgi:hypothetical protein